LGKVGKIIKGSTLPSSTTTIIITITIIYPIESNPFKEEAPNKILHYKNQSWPQL